MKYFAPFIFILFILAGCSDTPLPEPSAQTIPSSHENSTVVPVLPEETPARQDTPVPSVKMEDMGPVSDKPIIAADLDFDRDEVVAEMSQVASAVQDIIEGFSPVDSIGRTVFDVSDEERQMLLYRIGQLGYATADAKMDMGNPELIRSFYEAFQSGMDAEAGIYTFDGTICRITFLCREGVIYRSVSSIQWDSMMQSVIDFDEEMYATPVFVLTPKGYLFYGSDEASILHARTVSMLRVEPLGDENRRALQKYIDPLVSYASTGVFSLDWDNADLSVINFNDVFEFLYKLEYGVSADTVFTDRYIATRTNQRAVPAADFEAIITKYFFVSAESLREMAIYDSERQMYAFAPMMSPDASPAWEVVACDQSGDGTLVIQMEAVSPENLLDCAVSNTVEIVPYEDGSFRYISNRIMRHDEVVQSAVPTFQEYVPRAH